MADLPPTVVTEPLQAKKPRKRGLWLLVLVPFGCAGLCALIVLATVIMDPTILNLFNTGAARAQVSAGTYEGTVYTAPNDIFTCDFGLIMYDGFSPVLVDSQNVQEGSGFVYALNDLGTQYGVDYTEIDKIGGDLGDVLADSSNKDTLAIMMEGILPSRGPDAKIVYEEAVTDDILFAVVDNPGQSFLVQESNGVTKKLDLVEGYYVIRGEKWLYFAYTLASPSDPAYRPDSSDMKTRLDEFYQGCDFSK